MSKRKRNGHHRENRFDRLGDEDFIGRYEELGDDDFAEIDDVDTDYSDDYEEEDDDELDDEPPADWRWRNERLRSHRWDDE